MREWLRQWRMHRRMETDVDYWLRVNRWHELAEYNSRRAKGVAHTPEYEARMRLEQSAFDSESEEERAARLDPRA